MDINSAGLHIRKLLTYVTSLSEDKPGMYSKSKVKLQEIADTCTQVVSVISEILQTEVLQQDAKEFSQADPGVLAAVSKMHSAVDTLQTFVNSSDKSSVSENKSSVVRSYAKAFSQIVDYPSGVEYADICAKLLHNWFNARILRHHGSFRYNIKALPSWISAIVIAYSQSLRNQTSVQFVQNFTSWIQRVMNPDEDVQYAVPFEVHKVLKDPTESCATLESTVLWDILMNMGLNTLCNLNTAKLDENLVYSFVEKWNPSELDNYVYYRDYPSIFEKLNWPHRISRVEGDEQ